MRVRLKLKSNGSLFLSPNYHYGLSAAIYKLVGLGSEEFAKFLHDEGYNLKGKRFKLFNFSLRISNFNMGKNFIQLNDGQAELYFSTPIENDILKNLIIGSFKNSTIEIVSENIKTVFLIEQVELVPQPKFYSEMKFKLFSPMILSTRKIHNGKVSQYYLRYTDSKEEISKVLLGNLQSKCELIYGKPMEGAELELEWDREYIERAKASGKRIIKRSSIFLKPYRTINVIGNLLPFKIKAPVELIRIGYECGFGEKNSMGFGMAKAIG